MYQTLCLFELGTKQHVPTNMNLDMLNRLNMNLEHVEQLEHEPYDVYTRYVGNY